MNCSEDQQGVNGAEPDKRLRNESHDEMKNDDQMADDNNVKKNDMTEEDSTKSTNLSDSPSASYAPSASLVNLLMILMSQSGVQEDEIKNILAKEEIWEIKLKTIEDNEKKRLMFILNQLGMEENDTSSIIEAWEVKADKRLAEIYQEIGNVLKALELDSEENIHEYEEAWERKMDKEKSELVSGENTDANSEPLSLFQSLFSRFRGLFST